jgi:hypothetical protein
MKYRNNLFLLLALFFAVDAGLIGMDRAIKNPVIRLGIDLIFGLILLTAWWFDRKNK